MPVLELAIVNIISGSVLQMVRSTVAATVGAENMERLHFVL